MSGTDLAPKQGAISPKPAAAPAPVPSKPGASPLGNAASARAPGGGPAPVVDFGLADISESPGLEDYLDSAPKQEAQVQGRIGKIAQGVVTLHKGHSGIATKGLQMLSISHPNLSLLEPIDPVVVLKVEKGKRAAHVTVRKAAAATSGIATAIDKNPELVGMVGLDLSKFPAPKTTVEDGKLQFALTGVSFAISSLVHGTLDFGFTDDIVTFNASGAVKLPKGQPEPATLTLARDSKGEVSGGVDVPLTLGNVNGKIHAAFGPAGKFEVQGTIGVQFEKFSGEVTVMVADAATAHEAAMAQLGPAAIQASADEAKKPTASTRKGEKSIVGWGTLNFAVSEWLAGKAQVIIDDEGHLTVIGEIAPPAEVILFDQRDYVKNLFKLEARAAYGIPVIGNIFVFANVGLDALAKFGPGKLYAIKLQGTYSTNPKIAKSFSVEGTLNISAFAGIRLRAEGGVGLEVLGHDIKVGVGVNGLAGIRGYVQATPKIGMREVADPKAGKKTEFYLNGHMELAAQPFLGLSGDFFVQLDSPWWSPAPDKTWTWPLGSLEYPLPGQFGLGVDIDWVIGSGKFPEVKTGEAKFDAKNFMTDLVDDKVPAKSKGDQEKPGTWKEGPDPQPPAPTAGPVAKPQAGGPPAKGTGVDKPGQKADKANMPKDLATAKAFGEGSEDLGHFAEESKKHPMDHVEVEAEAQRLRSRYGFKSVTIKDLGDEWEIDAELNPKKKAKVKKASKKKPPISKTLKGLATTSKKSVSAVTPGKKSGSVYGTLVHSEFQRRVDLLGRPDIHTEITYKSGKVESYGTPDAVRLDVVRGKPAAPVEVWDLKTGSAKLTDARIQRIRKHLPTGHKKMPIQELRP